MFLYNETFGIDPSSEETWIRWMKEVYIPGVINTGMFNSFRFFKVLHESEDGTVSYSVQFFSSSINDVQQFLEVHAPPIVKKLHENFKDKHVAFRTLLQEV